MIGISEHMTFKDGETLIHMKLCGIVHFIDFHFTSRIIDSNENVWFHDGMVSGHECIYEKRLTEFTGSELSTCKGKLVSLVIYARS